ncbi:MAG: class I SAM-dependent methyltransferase [Candidatus Dormibacteraeota bacterium]|nr:class I SAM-dependent methyltransferase [Candidatus Dormibacteraeota bacterium]
MVDGLLTNTRSRMAAWLSGEGIEIGALHHPLAVPARAKVTYVDRLSESDLRVHYPELAHEAFAPIQVVGSAEDLSAFSDSCLDFVIANHLLEHLEYPVRGLLEFQRVLRPGGLLYMALPDMRLTFDRDRDPSSVEHLLEEHRHGASVNRRAHYLDWSTNVEGKRGADADAHAEQLMDRDYSIHFHAWRPDSFLDFFVAARLEFRLDFELVGYAVPERSEDNEFILLLAKADNGKVRLLPEPEAIHQALSLPPEPPPNPEPPAPSFRALLASSPLGPPVRLAKRGLRLFRAPAHH